MEGHVETLHMWTQIVGTLHEFILPYDEVRRPGDPGQALLAFAQSTYEAAAHFGAWDRRSLEVPHATLRAVNAK